MGGLAPGPHRDRARRHGLHLPDPGERGLSAHDPFVRLGDSVAAAWSRRNFDEAAFPQLATRALEDARLHEGFAPHAPLFDLMLREPGHAQSDGTFGDAPIVVYRGRGFFIEVLFWLDATTAIHTHAFSGAFQVLSGASIHATWRFSPAVRVRSTLVFGEVGFDAVEHLHAGDVRPIVAGDRFIHALFHLARPSVSLVLRTAREEDHLPQMNYLPPAVAWDPHEEDRVRDRRWQALQVLAETDRDAHFALLERVARESDLPALFHALRHAARRQMAPEALGHFADLARPRHGELADRLLATLLEHQRQHHIVARRAAVTDPQLRWLLALLLNVPSRREILRLIGADGQADATSTLLAGLRAMAQAHGTHATALLDLSVEHDEGGSQRVVSILVAAIAGVMAGEDYPDIVRRAAAAVGGLSLAEAQGIPKLVDDLQRPSSPFLSLFR